MNKQIKTMGKVICFLLVWNLVLSFIIVTNSITEQTEKLNQQICNLEAIPVVNENPVPDYELVEIE